MDIRNHQNIDLILGKVDTLPVDAPAQMARGLPLYIKALNDRGIVSNISSFYIDNYDGKTTFKKFKRHFETMHEMFLKNGLDSIGRREGFKRVAMRIRHFPRGASEMKHVMRVLLEEMNEYLRNKRLADARKSLSAKFTLAVKKYMRLTWDLGFNEPSVCVKTLAERHVIDKYIMSGDFSPMLLPFLPDVEDAIKHSYEHYEMKDAWEMLQGRYFAHKADYAIMALEIKSGFKRTVKNFSEYFDDMYTNTYKRIMLKS